MDSDGLPRTPRRLAWRNLAVALALLVALSSLFLVGALVATDPSHNLVLAGAELRTGLDGTRFIRGLVTNRTERECSEVMVELELLDAAGQVVGTTSALTDRLSAGRSWEFVAPVADERATGFRLGRITSPDNERAIGF